MPIGWLVLVHIVWKNQNGVGCLDGKIKLFNLKSFFKLVVSSSQTKPGKPERMQQTSICPRKLSVSPAGLDPTFSISESG